MSEAVPRGPLNGTIRFFLENKFVVFLLLIGVVFWGALVAPFDWEVGGLPRDPVPVDAIPDYGENQQIVFTEWMGRSPQGSAPRIAVRWVFIIEIWYKPSHGVAPDRGPALPGPQL